jgi:SAM-dependent methyltransferase
MRSNSLLRHALTKNPESVLDVGAGNGNHSIAFISNGCKRVVGNDLKESPLGHECYEHKQDSYDVLDLHLGGEQFDMVWCSHVLEHVANVQDFLTSLYKWLKPDGWLAIGVPASRQNRLHIGHLTLWTPAHLVYNLICAGWDCKEAIWYTEYLTIGLMVQKKDIIDLSWRTSLPNEQTALNQFTPKEVMHEDGAWWGNNWPEDLEVCRASDPPFVTAGIHKTNLPPECQLAFGPNPKLRKPHGIYTT